MKKSIFTLALTTFVAGTILISCSTPAEKVNTAEANVQQADQELDEAKAEYERFKLESDQRIAANEKRIAELKAYSKNVKKDMKDGYEKTIAELEAKNEIMKAKVRDYKAEGNEKWQSFKREFNHDMDELGAALKDLTENNAK